MSTANEVLQQIMQQLESNRDLYLHGNKMIWASKDPLIKALEAKGELEALGMEASVSSSLLTLGRVGLTVNLNTDHSIVRDVLPVLEEIMEDYELVDTNKSAIKGEVELKYCKEANNGRKVRLIVSILTGQSTSCRWVGTGKFVELQDLVCDEHAA